MTIARINDIPLNAPDETVDAQALRQRACTELLRQAAQRAGLLDASDAPGVGGAITEAAAAAIDAHIDAALQIPAPAEEDCRRYFAANAHRFASGERMHLRHVLFAVAPGVDVVALRRRAEAALLDIRASGTLAEAARTLSNCPTGREGGDLGWLSAADCATEFAKTVFAHRGCGVLPQLVHSRFGLHIVEVLAREPGVAVQYESSRGAVVTALQRQAFVTALRQYLNVLAAKATVEGVDLEASDSPLVQ